MIRCEDVLDVLESVAEGNAADHDVSAHLQACSRCAAALARARQVHRALETRPVGEPPPGFTSTILGRTRLLQWQSEQRLDWWFNATIAASFAIVALGIWGLMNVTGLSAVTVGTIDFVGRAVPAFYDQIKPSLPLYGTAGIGVAGGLAIWWWIERSGGPQRTA